MADDRKKKCPKQGLTTPNWMTTFGDMNTLLLTFFIAILTTAEIEGRELRLILSAFTGSFGMMEGGMTLSAGQLAEMGQTIESLPSREAGNQLSRAMRQVSELLKPELRARRVRIEETRKGYKISLASDIFFRPGSAEIDYDEGREALRKVGMMLREVQGDFKVEVIGHTDNTAIPPESDIARIYPSNWELSAARSASVVRYLVDFGLDPRIMYVEGRGEFEPLESNDTPEGRAYNRRIDIYITQDMAGPAGRPF
jgi:chemotaxis protein MotB